ncbi:MAG: hypothetical protein CUN53_12510, partial [Phototrophicales bacterium]
MKRAPCWKKADQSAGQVDDHEHQDQAVDDAAIFTDSAQHLWQTGQHHCAEDRTEIGCAAAEDGKRQNVDRLREAEAIGTDDAGEMS